jgi:hypothetical protein
MKIYLFLLSFIILSSSCHQKKKTNVPTLKTTPEFVDFHRQFYHSNTEGFSKLKKKYPYLFPHETPDSIWHQKRINREDLNLLEKVDSVFGNFTQERKKLTKLFANIHHNFPHFHPPKTFTLITNLDYEHPVTYADSLLFLSLDMYLGSDSEVYQSFPQYLSKNYEKSKLTIDVATQIIDRFVTQKKGSTFLEKIIHHGKRLFVLKTLLTDYSEQELMGHEKNKYHWMIENEARIWAYFIENKLLYSTDFTLDRRFNQIAPFSKFYLDIDPQTPDRIGIWLGLQIVKSYQRQTDNNLADILNTPPLKLFQESKYKPTK